MYQLRAWGICIAAALFLSYELMQFHMLNSLSNVFMKTLHLNAKDFSIICSTYLLADVMCLIPAGIILDRCPARSVILVSLGCCIVGTVGLAYSETFFQAAFSHFLTGIGNAFCFLSCMVLASSWFPRKSSFVMSMIITIGLLGGVVAQVPFSVLAQKVGWVKTLQIDALLGVFVWIVNFLFVYESPKYKRRVHFHSFQVFTQELFSSLSSSQTWKFGLYTAFMNLPLMIISAMIGNLYLIQVHGYEVVEASWVTSMIPLGSIVGFPLYGYLGDYIFNKRSLMIFGAAASFASFLMILLTDSVQVWSMACLFFSLGLFSASQVLSYPMIVEYAPQKLRGTCMGIAAIIIMGLPLIGQPLTGYLLDYSHSCASTFYSKEDFLRAMLIFPIGFLISILLSWRLKEKKQTVSMEMPITTTPIYETALK